MGVGVARARSHGLTYQSSITFFVVMMFEIAPNFDDHPLIRLVLTDEETSPEVRAGALADIVPGWVFRQASLSRDESVWGTPPEESSR